MDAYIPKPDQWDDLAKRYGVALPKAPPAGSDVSGLLGQMRKGTYSQESTNNYNVADNPRTGAAGGFQVLPENIPNWTEKHFKQRLTPEQFKANPAAQEAVFNGEMGGYLRAAKADDPNASDDIVKRKAAAMWYGGEKAMHRYDDPTRFRPKEPSFREYTTGVVGKGETPAPQADFNALSQRYGVTSPPSSNFDELSKRYGVPTDAQGGQPVPPTVAGQQTLKTPIAPETPQTIEAQLRSTNDVTSPRAATLLTDLNQRPLAKDYQFVPVETPQGMLLVNPVKAKALGITNIPRYVKQNGFAALIGKVEDHDQAQGNDTVVKTTDAQGNELAASKVSPENIQNQIAADKAQFPQAVNHEVTNAQQVVQDRQQADIQQQYNDFLAKQGTPDSQENRDKFTEQMQSQVNEANAPAVASNIAQLAPLSTASRAGKKPTEPMSQEQVNEYNAPVVNAGIGALTPVAEASKVGKKFQMPQAARTPQQGAQGSRQYPFEKTGQMQFANGESYQYLPDQSDPKAGQYKFQDKDGGTYSWTPGQQHIKQETVAPPVDQFDLKLLPEGEKGLTSEDAAKYVYGSQIADRLNQKFDIPKSDTTAFYQAQGFRDLNTGQPLPFDRYFAKGDKQTDTFKLAPSELRQMQKFSATRRTSLQDQVLGIIASGRELSPQEQKYFADNDLDVDALNRSRPDDLRMANVKGQIAKQDLDRLIDEIKTQRDTPTVRDWTARLDHYGLKPTDDMAARIVAARQVGQIDEPTMRQSLVSWANLRNEVGAELQKEAPKVGGAYPQAPQDQIEKPVTDEQINKRISELNEIALSPAERERAQREGSEVTEKMGNVGASIAAFAPSLVGATARFVGAADRVLGNMGLERGHTAYVNLAKFAQEMDIGTSEFGKEGGYVPQGIKFVTTMSGNLLPMVAASSTPLGMMGGFAINDAAQKYGAGGTPFQTVGAGAKGLATAGIFKFAEPVANYVVGNLLKKTLPEWLGKESSPYRVDDYKLLTQGEEPPPAGGGGGILSRLGLSLSPETQAALKDPKILSDIKEAQRLGMNDLLEPDLRRLLTAAKIVKQGVKLGFIGAGTGLLEPASGASAQETVSAMVQNIVMDFAMTHAKEAGISVSKAIEQLKGRVFDVQTELGMKTVSVEKDGSLMSWDKMPDEFKDATLFAKNVTPAGTPPEVPTLAPEQIKANREKFAGGLTEEEKAQLTAPPKVDTGEQAVEPKEPIQLPPSGEAQTSRIADIQVGDKFAQGEVVQDRGNQVLVRDAQGQRIAVNKASLTPVTAQEGVAVAPKAETPATGTQATAEPTPTGKKQQGLSFEKKPVEPTAEEQRLQAAMQTPEQQEAAIAEQKAKVAKGKELLTNESGTPRTFYHSTNAPLGTDITANTAQQFGKGVYFASEPKTVSGGDYGKRTLEAHLPSNLIDAGKSEYTQLVKQIENATDTDYYENNFPMGRLNKELQKRGYKGIIDTGHAEYGDQVMVFDPKDIEWTKPNTKEAREPENLTTNASGTTAASGEAISRAKDKSIYEVNKQGTQATNVGVDIDKKNPESAIAVVDHKTGEITGYQGDVLSEKQIAKVRETHDNLQKPEAEEPETYDLGEVRTKENVKEKSLPENAKDISELQPSDKVTYKGKTLEVEKVEGSKVKLKGIVNRVPVKDVEPLKSVAKRGVTPATSGVAIMSTPKIPRQESSKPVAKSISDSFERVVDKPIEDLTKEEFTRSIVEPSRAEVNYGLKTHPNDEGFYTDNVVRANKDLQKFAQKEYGRKLTPAEVGLYHWVSALGSPSVLPVRDSSLGLTILDHYIKTGELTSSVAGKMATEWERGVDTGKIRFREGEPVKAQGGKQYQADNLNGFIRLVDSFKGSEQAKLAAAIKWMQAEQTPAEMMKRLGRENLPNNEYIQKGQNAIGVFGMTGAKLGSYWLNRMGHFDTITKDMWYARTMARYFGTSLLAPNGEPLKLPWNETSQKKYREWADEAWNQLAKEFGLHPAEVQQIMWNFEKRLWEHQGHPSSDMSLITTGVEKGQQMIEHQKIPANRLTSATLGVAPLLEGTIKDLRQANREYTKAAYKALLDLHNDLRSYLGLTVNDFEKTVGAYEDTSANLEASMLPTVSGTAAQIEAYAALMGTLAKDVQKSVLISAYKTRADGAPHTEHRITFKDATVAADFIANRAEMGFNDLSYIPSTNTVVLLDFGDAKFAKLQERYGQEIKDHEQRSTDIRFLGQSEYAGVLQATRDSLPGYDKPTHRRKLADLLDDAEAKLRKAEPESLKSVAKRTGEEGLPESGRVRGGEELLADPYGKNTGTSLAGSEKPIEVEGRRIQFTGYKPAQDVAATYMESTGRPYSPPTEYVPLDKERATRIANEFDKMKHDPTNPEVRAAYDAMIKETAEQYKAILKTGLKIEFIDYDKQGDPYKKTPRLAILDVVENNHLWVFSTRDGFGSDEAFKPEGNPLLAETEFKISGKPALANDLFRVVHDYFGHIKDGNGFRARGEENAWNSHARMYSPEARRAMTTETRGQNSWVNFGPKAEENRGASGADTIYADQKLGLLPDWASTPDEEGLKSVAKRDQTETPEFKKWFGDSEVVNSKGEPLVTYRGESEEREILHGGAFFTDSPKDASAYAELAALQQAVDGNDDLNEIVSEILAEEGGENITDLGPQTIRDIADANGIDLPEVGGHVTSAYLKMENPLDLTDYGSDVGDVEDLWNDLHKQGLLDEDWNGLDEFDQQDLQDKYDRQALYRFLEEEGVQAKAFKQGFDGVIFTDMSPDGGKTHTTWLVKDPLKQVKSTENRGTFSPNEDSILKSVATLFRIRDEQTDHYLHEVLPRKTGNELMELPVEDLDSGRIDADGTMELSPKAAEVLRRVEAGYTGKNVAVFDGALWTPKTFKTLAPKVHEAYDAAVEAGHSKATAKWIKDLANNLDKLGEQTKGHGVLYVYDEAKPEELTHKEDILSGGTDDEANKALDVSPFMVDAGKVFEKDYKGVSKANKRREIFAKLATNQEAYYGWNKMPNFEAEKQKFLNEYADGILRQNGIETQEDFEKFTEEFGRIAAHAPEKYYAKTEEGLARRGEATEDATAGEPSDLEGTGGKSGETAKAPVNEGKDIAAEQGAETKPAEVSGTDVRQGTSTKNAVAEEERAQRGLSPIETSARREFGTLWGEAQKLNRDDPRAIDRLVSELRKKPRPVSDLENAQILQRKVEVRNENNDLARQLTEAVDKGDDQTAQEMHARLARTADELHDLDQITKHIGSETARGLNARRMMAKEDMTLASLELQKRAAKGGEKLSDAERDHLQKIANDYAAKTKELEARIAQLEGQRIAKRIGNKADLEAKRAKYEAFLKDRFNVPEASESLKSVAKRDLDDESREALTALGALDILNNKSVGDTMNHLDRLSGGQLTIEALQDIHADALKAATAVKNPMSDEKRLSGFKQRTTSKMTELEHRIAAKVFTKKPQRPLPMDREAQQLQVDLGRIKRKYEAELTKDRLANRTKFEKTGDAMANWARFSFLSWPTTLAKLTSAALQRTVSTPIENLAGSAYKAVPYVRQIAARAPSEQGLNIRTEGKAIASMITHGMKDAWDILRGEESEQNVLYGKRENIPATTKLGAIGNFFGQLHGALKAPVKRAAFTRSLENRTNFAIDNGVDVTDPIVEMALALEAYKDANRAIFMHDSRAVSAYKRLLQGLEQKDKEGKVPLGGKVAATALRITFPVVKIPINFATEVMQYAGGLPYGLLKTAKVFKNGVEDLPPEQADHIMRLLKKGLVGVALLLLGYFNRDKFGGYYQPGEKRKENEPQAAGIRIFGVNLPKYLLHSPPLEVMQLGATIGRVADSKWKKGSHDTKGVFEGMIRGGIGLAEEIPFVQETIEAGKALDPRETSDFIGEFTKSRVVPGLVQWTANKTDTDTGNPVTGTTVKRDPKGFWQHLETGVPGLRQRVKRKHPR